MKNILNTFVILKYFKWRGIKRLCYRSSYLDCRGDNYVLSYS